MLGETDGLGTHDPRAVIGIGVNTDWAAADFPPDLAASMTSLREAGRRPSASTRAGSSTSSSNGSSRASRRFGRATSRAGRGLPAR